MTAVGRAQSTDSTVGVPWRSPALVAILAATLMTPMDVPLISPALTEVQTAFGVPAASAGLLITAYALPGIVVGPAIGLLADRVERRYVLAGCLVVFGLAGTAIAVTGDFRLALALRVLQGVAAGSILSALAMTLVGDRYAGRQHDAVMGVTSASLSFGTALYPLLGGVLAARAWNAPFLLYALAVPVAGLVLVSLEGSGRPAQDTSGRTATTTTARAALRRARAAIPVRRAATLYAVMFASFLLLFGGLYTALPFHLVSTFGLPPTAVGLVTSAVLVLTGIVSTQNGRLTAYACRSTLVVIGFASYALGFIGVGLADSLPVLVATLLVFGAGNGLVTPTLFAGISALAPDRYRGGLMGLQTTTIGASQVVGPVLFTTLGARLGYRTTLLAAGVVAALCTAGATLLRIDGAGRGQL